MYRSRIFYVLPFLFAATSTLAFAEEQQTDAPTDITPSAVPFEGDFPVNVPLDDELQDSEDQIIREKLRNRVSPDRHLPAEMIGPDREPIRIWPDDDVVAPLDQQKTDPDTSIDIQNAWSSWHKDLDKYISERFDQLATKFFAPRGPLSCQVSYCISSDGRLTKIRIIKKSHDMMFNSTALAVLHSIRGNPKLAFPKGSLRTEVEQITTFNNPKIIAKPGTQKASPPR